MKTTKPQLIISGQFVIENTQCENLGGMQFFQINLAQETAEDCFLNALQQSENLRSPLQVPYELILSWRGWKNNLCDSISDVWKTGCKVIRKSPLLIIYNHVNHSARRRMLQAKHRKNWFIKPFSCPERNLSTIAHNPLSSRKESRQNSFDTWPNRGSFVFRSEKKCPWRS